MLAQVEVSFSNSLVEAFWRMVLPHAAFHGQTPDEIYFGRGDQVPTQLAEGRSFARERRLQANRVLSCGDCRTPTIAAGPSEPVPLEKREPQ